MIRERKPSLSFRRSCRYRGCVAGVGAAGAAAAGEVACAVRVRLRDLKTKGPEESDDLRRCMSCIASPLRASGGGAGSNPVPGGAAHPSPGNGSVLGYFSQSPRSTVHVDPEQLATSVPAHALVYMQESEPGQGVRGAGS